MKYGKGWATTLAIFKVEDLEIQTRGDFGSGIEAKRRAVSAAYADPFSFDGRSLVQKFERVDQLVRV